MAIAFLNSASATGPGAPATITFAFSVPAGNTVIVAVAITNQAGSVTSISDDGPAGGSVYSFVAAQNGSSARIELWATSAGGATGFSNLTVNLTGVTATATVCAARYSGVTALGASSTTSGASANPSIAQTTVDGDNWIVAGFAVQNVTTPTALTGNLRVANSTADNSLPSSCAINDNTATTPSSVTNAVTEVFAGWDAAALELRALVPVDLVSESDLVYLKPTFEYFTFALGRPPDVPQPQVWLPDVRWPVPWSLGSQQTSPPLQPPASSLQPSVWYPDPVPLQWHPDPSPSVFSPDPIVPTPPTPPVPFVPTGIGAGGGMWCPPPPCAPPPPPALTWCQFTLPMPRYGAMEKAEPTPAAEPTPVERVTSRRAELERLRRFAALSGSSNRHESRSAADHVARMLREGGLVDVLADAIEGKPDQPAGSAVAELAAHVDPKDDAEAAEMAQTVTETAAMPLSRRTVLLLQKRRPVRWQTVALVGGVAVVAFALGQTV